MRVKVAVLSAVLDLVLGLVAMGIVFTVMVAWLFAGSHSLGLPGAWAHAVAAAAFMALTDTSLDSAQRKLADLDSSNGSAG